MLSENQNWDQSHPLIIKESSGKKDAWKSFVSAYKSNKFAHSWIIAGPRGIGKAMLALRTAHYILSYPDSQKAPNLLENSNTEDKILSQIQSGSHPDLLVLRRAVNIQTGKLKQEISVGEARKVSRFFERRASGKGWRICIIDTADDLNHAAANALLKIVEEPPQKSLIIFISNSLGRLLPTLRSRCRVLKCAMLSEAEIIQVLEGVNTPETQHADIPLIAALSEGSLALGLGLLEEGLEVYQDMMACLETLPDAQWGAINKYTASLSGAGNRDQFSIFANMVVRLLQRMAVNTAKDDWPSSLAREEALSKKWCMDKRLHSFSNFTNWLETCLSDKEEFNLDTTLTATQIFQELSRIVKTGTKL